MSRPHRHEERGSAALEFAIAIPVILMFIFGVIQYGYLFWSLQTAAATAREAARQLVVGTDWGCVQSQAQGQADNPALGTAPPTVTRTYYDTAGNVSAAGPVVGGLVKVDVSFQSLDMHLPLLPVPHGGVVSDDAEARVENIPAVALAC